MSEYVADEGNLRFDFTHCGKPIKFDKETYDGMKAVDFVVDNEAYLLFIEVKDYQNPNATDERRNKDIETLHEAMAQRSLYALEMGSKIKDSLLSCYAEGNQFTKDVIYLLFINLDIEPRERRLLYERIKGYVPTGLNEEHFTAFKNIEFELVNAEILKEKYGIACKAIS
jgi:hypothetical protein